MEDLERMQKGCLHCYIHKGDAKRAINTNDIESDYHARPLNYEWVLDIREQCVKKNVHFDLKDLCKQAKLANIDY